MSPAFFTHSRRFLVLSASAVVAAVLTGCGAGALDKTASGSLKLTGSVHGGQQPVTSSIIRLYSAGKGGNGTAAVDMLKVTTPAGAVDYVTSDANGNFSITGDYTCANANDQVYITATNGNPGLPNPNSTNPALAMMTALGNCAALLNQTAYPYITINEVTTVAAAYALAPFMTSPANLASSATNSVGITNAFLNANLLADPATGTATTLPSNLTTETGKLYALANVIAACVNSDGTGGACSQLFAYTKPVGGTTPTDTLTAALDVVKNPSHNVAAIFQSSGTQPPFSTNLVTAPNDWTMSLTVTGGGVSAPTALGVDSFGNVWVADYEDFNTFTSGVSAFNPQGRPYSATRYTAPNLSEIYGLVVDVNNNVWATSQETPTHAPTKGQISAFLGANSGSSLGTNVVNDADVSLDFPEAMANDNNGNILVANYANGTASVYNANGGALVASNLGSGYALLPQSISADGNHGIWFGNNGTTTVTHVTQNGTLIATSDCCNGPNGIARDSAGNVWVSNYYGQVLGDGTITPGSFSEVSDSGAVLINQSVGGGLNHPAGVRIDAAQNVWIASYQGASIVEVAGINSSAPGSFLSPSTGLGKDASLSDPFAVAPDPSGNVWVSSYGSNSLVMFFGIATPTATPAGPVPLAP